MLPRVPEAPCFELALLTFLVSEDDHNHRLDRGVGPEVFRGVLVRLVVDGQLVELAFVDIRHPVLVNALGRRNRRLERVLEPVWIVTIVENERFCVTL